MKSLGGFLKYATLSKQRKAASTWARRKTHISTPVATTTNAEGRMGGRGHVTSRGTCLMLDGRQTNHLWIYNPRKCPSCALDALADMFISFVPYGSEGCWTLQKRISCCSDWVGRELMTNAHFSPSFIPLFLLWSLRAGPGK